MVGFGFLNENNAPKLALQSELQCLTQAVLDKIVILFQDRPTFWGIKGTTVLKPKLKVSNIMVSDLIDEKWISLLDTRRVY